MFSLSFSLYSPSVTPTIWTLNLWTVNFNLLRFSLIFSVFWIYILIYFTLVVFLAIIFFIFKSLFLLCDCFFFIEYKSCFVDADFQISLRMLNHFLKKTQLSLIHWVVCFWSISLSHTGRKWGSKRLSADLSTLLTLLTGSLLFEMNGVVEDWYTRIPVHEWT